MTGELSVHVNRDGVHAVEVPDSFEAAGSFTLAIVNHGEPIHVHLHLDERLSQVARIEGGNYHVSGDDTRRIVVEVDERALRQWAEGASGGSVRGATGRGQPGEGDAIRGRIKVTSAYGSDEAWTDVDIRPPEASDEDEGVRVDESLGTPPPREEPRAFDDPLQVGAVVAVALALVLAVVAGLLVGDFVVGFGLFVLVLVVFGGLLYSARSDRR